MRQYVQILLFIFINVAEAHSMPFQFQLNVGLNDFGSSYEQNFDKNQRNEGFIDNSVEDLIQNPAFEEILRQYFMENPHTHKYFSSENFEIVPSSDILNNTDIIDEGCRSKRSRSFPEILPNIHGVHKYILKIGNLTQSVWTEKCDTKRNTHTRCSQNKRTGYKDPTCEEVLKRISLLTLNIRPNNSHNSGVNVEFDDFLVANGCVCKATQD